MSDHVSGGSDLNAPLGQLLEPISSSETRDVKPGLERKSSNLAISGLRGVFLEGEEIEGGPSGRLGDWGLSFGKFLMVFCAVFL